MALMRLFYNITYRYFRAPWDVGPRKELVDLVESGKIKPCRTIDLGSGTASNCIFLARNGFEVTGVDYSVAAVEKGRTTAEAAGVHVDFVVDNLTKLRFVHGTFDLLVDYGTLDDLIPRNRDKYVENVLPLTQPGSLFLLYCFEWTPKWWEKAIYRLSIFGAMALEPGEVERRFGDYFTIEEIAGHIDYSTWPPGYKVYLMTRKDQD